MLKKRRYRPDRGMNEVFPCAAGSFIHAISAVESAHARCVPGGDLTGHKFYSGKLSKKWYNKSLY